jgi:hypothetical protein
MLGTLRNSRGGVMDGKPSSHSSSMSSAISSQSSSTSITGVVIFAGAWVVLVSTFVVTTGPAVVLSSLSFLVGLISSSHSSSLCFTEPAVVVVGLTVVVVGLTVVVVGLTVVVVGLTVVVVDFLTVVVVDFLTVVVVGLTVVVVYLLEDLIVVLVSSSMQSS